MEKMQTKAGELEFVMTCCACPEQYVVYSGDEKVGYIRLRWGVLSCRYGSHGRDPVTGRTLLRHDFGEEYKGCFAGEDERGEWLCRCGDAIARKIRNESERVKRLRKRK